MVATFEQCESEARSYCRSFPALLDRSKGSYVYSSGGTAYLDFLSGAGALNYGHNDPAITRAVIDYLNNDGIVTALDLHTVAKKNFIEGFCSKILAPKSLEYKLQFTGPTGTNVVESAVKLARKVTARSNVVAFTNAFHGMSGAALSLTGNRYHRQSFLMAGVTRLPYDGYLGEGIDTTAYFRKLLEDDGSGLDPPAAVVVETVQGEGGVNVASPEWLRELRELTQEFKIILIVDDIQTGCGRTGSFFSFEESGIRPDLVCLSKSLSGIGTPLSLLLISPEYDRWAPGEDNGTFRGNNLAFVSALAAIEHHWDTGKIEKNVQGRVAQVRKALAGLRSEYSEHIHDVRGRGLMHGIEFRRPETARQVSEACFGRGLIVETCGARDQVVKLMPPLNISEKEMTLGLDIISDAIAHCTGADAYPRTPLPHAADHGISLSALAPGSRPDKQRV